MLVPQLIVRDMAEAVTFLTRVLDFEAGAIEPDLSSFYAILMRGADELHLQLAPGHGRYGHSAVIVVCEDVDGLVASFKARGLILPDRPASPVHCGPVDQTWGTREIYIEDPSGNTIIYQQR